MIKINTKFTFEDLYLAFGPRNLNNLEIGFEFNGISIDTRTIEKGQAFIAIEGENHDGHSFIESAIEKGTSIIFGSAKWFDKNREIVKNIPFVSAKSGLSCLHKLAAFHRAKFNTKIVAVAGSNGKTTTKELIAAILEKKYKTLKTYKNFNNQIGVPLMLLCLDDSIEVAVLEIGTNSYGEIKILTELVRPTHGLITNIAEEHFEKLIDLDGVEMEETSLFAWCRQNNAYSIINLDDERLKKYVKALEKRMTFGRHVESNLRVKAEFDDNYYPSCRYIFHDEKFSAKLKMPGESAVQNSAAAAVVGFLLDLKKDEIKNVLENFETSDEKYGRMKIEKKNELTIFNDSYNSNPGSVKNAFQILENITAKRKIAILGDMKELGEKSKELHYSIVNESVQLFDLTVFYGEEFNKLCELESQKAIFTEDKSEIIDLLKNEKEPDTAVLVKGSRSMKLEEILERL